MADGMREKTTNVGGVIKRIWYAMTGATQGAELMSIDDAGKLKCASEQITGLAGTGNRMVVADSSGNLSASAVVVDSVSSFVPVISSDYGVITSYTASAIYSVIGKMVIIESYVTISDKGTASGDLKMSLPYTTVTYGFVSGQNLSDCITLGGVASGGTAYLRKTDGTTPILSGKTYQLTAIYFKN